MDDNIIRYLKKKDNEKGNRQKKQRTKEYKAMRSSNRYNKFAESHRDQLEELKTGANYETDVTVKIVKKSLKEAPICNQEGTLLSEWKCPYFSKK